MNKINKKSIDRDFTDIFIGASFEFEHTIKEEDIAKFAELTGDYNPLHTDEGYAHTTMFGKRVVHGMLGASFFSTLIGMYCPGRKALYLSQAIQFRKPLFIGDSITIRGIVVSKNNATQCITIKTEIIRDNLSVITGEAIAKVL